MRQISYLFSLALVLGGCGSDTASSSDADNPMRAMGGVSASAMGNGGGGTPLRQVPQKPAKAYSMPT